MSAARVLAQAKVNLFLRVLAREASGYHQIETLFCRLAFGDDVTVRPTDGDRSIECRGAVAAGGLGPAEENLAWRAGVAYGQRAGWPRGFAIEIEKRIPVGGGLGGGSADAGAVLRALNALNPAPLPMAGLLAIAASLGADVAFCTQDASTLALGWGRGERLLALAPLPPRRCWLFRPSVSVSTREAYQWLAELPAPGDAVVREAAALSRWDDVAALAHNDFEDVVGERVPELARALAALRAPAARALVGAMPLVHMSGTGSTIFVVHGDNEAEDGWPWRSDEPGFTVIQTATADRVEAVALID